MSASVTQSSFQPTIDAVNRGDSIWVTLAHAVCDFISKIWNWLFPMPAEQVEVKGSSDPTRFDKRTSEYMKDLESFMGDYINSVYPNKDARGMDVGYIDLHTYLYSKNPPPIHAIEEFILNNYLLQDKEMTHKERVIRSIYTLVFAKNHPQLMKNQTIKIENMEDVCRDYKPYISAGSLASSGLGESFQDMGLSQLTVPTNRNKFEALKKAGINGAFIESYFRGKCWKYVSSDVNEQLCLAYIEGYGKSQDHEVLIKWTNILNGGAS